MECRASAAAAKSTAAGGAVRACPLVRGAHKTGKVRMQRAVDRQLPLCCKQCSLTCLPPCWCPTQAAFTGHRGTRRHGQVDAKPVQGAAAAAPAAAGPVAELQVSPAHSYTV